MNSGLRILTFSAALLTPVFLRAATITWDGGGGDDNMLTANNWSTNTIPLTNDDIVFAGGVRLTPLVSSTFFTNSLTFNNTAGAFGFNGLGTLFIGAGGMTNNDADTMTFNCLVSANAAAVTFNAASGGLNFTNTVGLGANTLTLTGGSAITLGGAITGTGTLTKNGAGALTINTTGTAIGADLTLNAGVTTLAATGTSQTFSGTSTIAIGAGGTFNINQNMVLASGAQLTRANGAGFGIAAGKTLTVQGGSNFISSSNALHTFNGANLTVTGSGSTVQLNAGSAKFSAGSALTIQGGAGISALSYIDVGDTGTGSILVDGTSSSFTSGGTSYWGNGGTANVTFSNSATGNIGGIDAARSGGSVAVIQVNTGADVTSGSLSLGFTTGAGANGTLTVNGSGSTWTQSGAATITIGAASGSTAALNIQNNGVFTTGTGLTTVNATGKINLTTGGSFIGNGNVTLTGTGAQLNRSGGAFLLAAGKTLSILADADANFSDGGLAEFAGGNLTVSGLGSTFDSAGTIVVKGSSTLTASDSAYVSADSGMAIGYDGSPGTLALHSSAQVDASFLLFVGYNGVGTLTADGGSGIFAPQAIFGENGSAVVTLNGSTGAFDNGVAMAGTPGATANVQVLAGSQVSNGGGLFLASNAAQGATGTLTLNGGGTLWQQFGDAPVTIGADSGSSATLNVQNGATFVTGTGVTTVDATGRLNIAGGTFQSQGNMTLNGTGAQLVKDASGTLFFGLGRTLTIQGGADAVIASAFTPTNFGGGSVVVTGVGSTFQLNGVYFVKDSTSMTIENGGSAAGTNGGGFGIGDAGQGTLIVRTGGTVSAEIGIAIGFNSGSGFLTVDGAGSSVSSGGISGFGVNAADSDVTFSNGATGAFSELIAAESGSSSATVQVLSGADVSLTGSFAMANTTAIGVAGLLTINGAGSTWTQTGSNSTTLGAASGSTATLNVENGGAFTSGTGAFNLNTTATVNINGGTLTINGLLNTAGALNFNSGTLNLLGPNNLTVGTGGLFGPSLTLLANRQLAIGGTTTIDAARTLTIDGGAFRTGALVNNGTIAFLKGTLGITGAGGFNIGTGVLGSNVILAAGANLQVTNTASIASAAALTLNGGSFSAGNVSASGTMRVNSGTATINGGTITSGGRVFVSDTLVLGNAATLTNAIGGRLTMENGGVIAGGASGFLVNSGLLTGDGTIAASFANSGEVRAESTRTLFFSGANGANTGQLTLLGGTLDFSNTLSNGPTGFITGSGALRTGALTNSGVMAFSGGNANVFGDTSNAAGARIITSGGATTTFFDDVVHNGIEIRTSAGGSTVFFGSQTGSGLFTGTGTVYYEGDLRPGNSPATVSYGGSVVLGSFSTTTMEIGGTIEGTQYDSLNIASSLFTDGTLVLSLINGYSPGLGAMFDLFDAATISGTFDTITLPALGQYLAWNTSQLYSTGTVSVASTLTPIEQWRLTHFSSPANSGDGADTNDFDRDGIANLVEYALGMDPRTPAIAGLPTLSVITVGANQHIALTFTRPLSASDVTYLVEVGSAPGAFLPGSAYGPGGDVPVNANTTQVSRTPAGPGFETLVIRDNTPVSSATARLLRLRVSNP